MNKYWEGKLINSQYIIDKLIISTCQINRTLAKQDRNKALAEKMISQCIHERDKKTKDRKA